MPPTGLSRTSSRAAGPRSRRALVASALTMLLTAGVLGVGALAAPAAGAAAPLAASTAAGNSTVATTTTAAAAEVRAAQAYALRAFDRDLLAYINRARAAHRLPALVEQPRLVLLAHSWSTHLASGSPSVTFGHNPALRATVLTGLPGMTAYGENIATFSTGSSAYSVLKAYLASPHHRANILSPAYRYAGIVTHTGPGGMSFNAMDFAG